jgi:hypothetical protein
MDDRKQEYLKVLNQKLEALQKMLKATKSLNITGKGEDDDLVREAELFSSLYEQRNDIFTQIQKMDEALSQFKDIEEDKELAKARKPIVDNIKETAKELAELDKKHLETSKKLTLFLKGGLKKIRDGRDVNNAYNVDAYGASSGSYFDSTK